MPIPIEFTISTALALDNKSHTFKKFKEMSNTRIPEIEISAEILIDDRGHESDIFCVEHKGKSFLLLEEQDYLCVIDAIDAFLTCQGIVNPFGYTLKASVEEVKVIGENDMEASLYNICCPPNDSLTLESISDLAILMEDMKLFFMLRKAEKAAKDKDQTL